MRSPKTAAGQHHYGYGDITRVIRQRSEKLQAIQVWQVVVEQNTVRFLLVGELQSLPAGIGFGKQEFIVYVARKGAPAGHAIYRVVLDKKHTNQRPGHLRVI